APPTTEPPPTTALPSTAPLATAPPPPPGRAAVEISQFYFKPSPLTVTAPTTVTWTNRDNILHTATSGTPESPDKRFDGPMDGAGTSFEFTFTRPGSYKYFCSRHKSMVGEVVVN
ncbi:MAG: cupredoxin domain-containing protein, partial [Acidimicrobiia bacterium]